MMGRRENILGWDGEVNTPSANMRVGGKVVVQSPDSRTGSSRLSLSSTAARTPSSPFSFLFPSPTHLADEDERHLVRERLGVSSIHAATCVPHLVTVQFLTVASQILVASYG
jgi:hypothetical protein